MGLRDGQHVHELGGYDSLCFAPAWGSTREQGLAILLHAACYSCLDVLGGDTGSVRKHDKACRSVSLQQLLCGSKPASQHMQQDSQQHLVQVLCR